MIRKIISGGQTGVDRAALDFAIDNNIPHGGWAPKGRLAEDGSLSAKYSLAETASNRYEERTRKNIIDSDGTLIISQGMLTGGSALTLKLAAKYQRPVLHVDLSVLDISKAAEKIRQWIDEYKIAVINVAGPRASGNPMIYELTSRLLAATLRHTDK